MLTVGGGATVRISARMCYRGLRAGLGLLLLAAAGCGWTARDEFYESRGVALRAQPGEGTVLSSHPGD